MQPSHPVAGTPTRSAAPWRSLIALGSFVLGLAACSDSSDSDTGNRSMFSFPTPQLRELDITPQSRPWLPTNAVDLAALGYRQREFAMSGTARSYTSAVPLSADGRWQVAPADAAAYATRLIVFAPADPAAFNGTLVVEWLNVSGGTDAGPDWTMLHTELVRRGYAWAGVSAQSVGVEGGGFTVTGLDFSLKKVDPARYGDLSHPGDSFSYAIFSQAAQVLRHPRELDPLAGLAVERVLAVGESQSAARLMTWVDAFGPFTDLFDGYLIHSRLGSGAPLSQAPQQEQRPQDVQRVREDLGRPVIMLQTDTDLFLTASQITSGTSYASRQADTATFRLWEVAGTAHADYYSFAGSDDPGGDPSYVEIAEKPVPNPLTTCPEPVNTGPQHLVAKAAIAALDAWVRDGTEPPSAARVAVTGSPPAIALDEHGNTLGGVRTPHVDVPIATFGGVGAGESILCTLSGSTYMFSTDKAVELYGDRASYASAVSVAADAAVDAGFLLAEDAELVKAAAQQVDLFP